MSEEYQILLWSVGCRANQSDRQMMLHDLESMGFRAGTAKAEAEVYIIFSCCVTAAAERDSRKLARKALGFNPEAKVIIYGCMSDYLKSLNINPMNKIPDLPARLVGHTDRKRLLEDLKETLDRQSRHIRPVDAKPRTTLKVQTGCSRACAYCVVPAARGSCSSMNIDEVLESFKKAVDSGSREIVLTGVNLGDWGSDFKQRRNLYDLLTELEKAAVPEVRIRLSSIEPWALSFELVDLVLKGRGFCPHLHVPVQSADPALLDRMGRNTDLYKIKEVIDKAVSINPGFAFGMDLIAGLPTETQNAFENSLRFIEEVSPAYLHVFGYSKRPGTRAAGMDGQIERGIIKERVHELIKAGRKKTLEFVERNKESERDVLITGRKKSSYRGLTDNFLEVELTEVRNGDKKLEGERVTVKLENGMQNGRWIMGSILS